MRARCGCTIRSKKLHCSDLNARAMTEVSHRTLPGGATAAACSRLQPRQVRNQFFILLSVLLGQGRTMADVCIRGMLLLSHKKVQIDHSTVFFLESTFIDRITQNGRRPPQMGLTETGPIGISLWRSAGGRALARLPILCVCLSLLLAWSNDTA